MRAEDLVGAWRELGREFIGGDGSVRADVPRTSQIMYTPDGFMGVVNTPAKRARVGEGSNPMSLDGLAAAERAAAAEGVVAYSGRYEVKGDIVHHVIYSSLNPNLVGTRQERRVTLSGDDLTLATLPDAKGNYFRIRWRRASKMT
ncbi:MAG TPA: lipocalin-like domain-containing protein [Pseudolabrys sp.]|nr:lipocalin-like domain-containing protein [Pseudolabrys sp.]